MESLESNLAQNILESIPILTDTITIHEKSFVKLLIAKVDAIIIKLICEWENTKIVY